MASILAPPRPFLRAVHLERDLADRAALSALVLTSPIQEALERLIRGLHPNSPKRAWRVTGDYGVGKSTLALAFARIVSSDEASLPSVLSAFRRPDSPRLLPLLAMGRRESICVTLANAVDRTEKQLGLRRKSTQRRTLTPDIVLDRIHGLRNALPKRYTGLLVVIDELGRSLETVADRGHTEDLVLLQDLADHSARSGDAPLITLALLHQGFESYASGLSGVARREWAKVAGRYDEIVFRNDVGTTAQLVSEALGTNTALVPRETMQEMESAATTLLDQGWFSRSMSRVALVSRVAALYPLHPAVLPVMSSLLRRVGQNERSIYTWLHGDEGGSVARWAAKASIGELYRVSDAFEYVRANLSHVLGSLGARAHWSRAVQIVDSVSGDSPDQSVLATVALLNLLDQDGFRANTEVLTVCLDEAAKASLRSDNVRNHLFGKAEHGYRLWSSQHVSLDQALRSANDAVATIDVIRVVSDVLDLSPIVARRHAIETGTMRHYGVRVIRGEQLVAFKPESTGKNDGTVLIVVPTAERTISSVVEAAKRLSSEHDELVVGVAAPLMALDQLARSVEHWRWIRAHTPELAHDEVAADEVRHQLQMAERALRSHAELSLGLSDPSALTWFSGGRKVSVDKSRGLSALLSSCCDARFRAAPIWKNELLNRRSVSTAAAAARQKLIEALFEDSAKPGLGLPEETMPPEKSAYLSLIAESGLHAKRKHGRWTLEIPPADRDPCRVRPLFDVLFDVLNRADDRRQKVPALWESLQAPPIGAREGVLPLILAVFVAAHPGEIALYEDDTFVPGVDGNLFQRMLKDPNVFELQWLPTTPQYKKLYSALNDLLHRSDGESDLIVPVRALIGFGRSLPFATRTTRSVSLQARRVRDALLSARDPARLLLKDLPQALGLAPLEQTKALHAVSISSYINGLRATLNELEEWYPKLLVSIRDELQKALKLSSSDVSIRADARAIGHGLSERVSDVRLRGFCQRLADKALDDRAWAESVASFVAERPPKDWRDDDRRHFSEELQVLSNRLERVRLIAERIPLGGNGAVHVYLTGDSGREVARIVPAARDSEQSQVHALVNMIRAAVGPATPLTLLAATEYLRSELEVTALSEDEGRKSVRATESR